MAAILRGDIDGVKSAVYDDSADPNSCLGCRDVGAPLVTKRCSCSRVMQQLAWDTRHWDAMGTAHAMLSSPTPCTTSAPCVGNLARGPGMRDLRHPQEIKPCGTCFNGSFAALHLVAEQWKTNPGIDPATWPAMIDVLVADLGAQPNLLDYQPEAREYGELRRLRFANPAGVLVHGSPL